MEYSAAFPERRTGEREWAGAKPCPGCNVRILRPVGRTGTVVGFRLLFIQILG